nr:hypothetical protein CE91St29_06620 [Corynebacterium striatum]
MAKSLTGVPDIKDNAGRVRAHKLTHAPHSQLSIYKENLVKRDWSFSPGKQPQ